MAQDKEAKFRERQAEKLRQQGDLGKRAADAEAEVIVLRTQAVPKTEHDAVVAERDQLKTTAVPKTEHDAVVAERDQLKTTAVPKTEHDAVVTERDQLKQGWPKVNGNKLDQATIDGYLASMPKFSNGTEVTAEHVARFEAQANVQLAPAVPSGLAAIKLAIFDFINTKEGSKYPGAGVEDLTQEVCSGKEVKDSVDSSIHTQPFNLEKFCENAVVGEDYDPSANI